jgi:ribosome-binding protein aMBF1 (putative translation factor)
MTIRRDTCKICGAARWERSEMRFCQQHHNEYHARAQRESQSAAQKRRERMTTAYTRLHVRELVDLTKGAA